MISTPAMLVRPAEKAGIKVPQNLDNYDKARFPHFHVFTALQCGRPLPFPTAHWRNATVVAGIAPEEIQTVTEEQVCGRGFV
jgi:hypothetical protein